MSTCPNVFAPTDLAPLQEAILSGEERHVDAAMAAMRAHFEDYSPEELAAEQAEWRPLIRAVVFGEGADEGVSGGAVELLARGLGIIEGYSLMEDWKLWAWLDYQSAVAETAGPEAAALLHHLCEGRPFPHQIGRFEHTRFAWLNAAEAATLRSALDAVDPATLPDELDEFHEELLGALDAAEHGLLTTSW